MKKKRSIKIKELLDKPDLDSKAYSQLSNSILKDNKELTLLLKPSPSLTELAKSFSSIQDSAKQFSKLSETSSQLAKSLAIPSEAAKQMARIIGTQSETAKQMAKIIGTPSETMKQLFQSINTTSAIAKEFANINKTLTAPYEEMFKSIRVSLQPFEEMRSSILNTALKTTLDFEKFDNGILRRGTTVLENSTLNDFQLTRRQSYEALLKPIEVIPLPENKTEKEITRLRGEVSELKTLLLKVTQEKTELTKEYLIEQVKRNSPQKLYLSYGSKEVSFRTDTNMAKICEFVFHNATERNLSISMEKLLKELFGVDTFMNDKDEVLEYKEKIRKTIINLNNKIEQKLGKTPFIYTKDTIKVVRS